ncbi:rhodanese-like domain-containing protein, partial [Cupriavidus basilensis]|uniref:rhodanese-like domain-containing protein n=1 Tax=Cupriavidus basilensis TaxID=68895 RepID=UPI001D4F2521|nr:sulfurtransferase [Cupriavidus basilensis]
MTQSIDAVTLRGWLNDGQPLALFDVREHGQYGEGHPFFAVPLPYSRLELDVARLAPRLAERIVLFDDGDGVAGLAAQRLAGLGYSNLALLAGGAAAGAPAPNPRLKGGKLA